MLNALNLDLALSGATSNWSITGNGGATRTGTTRNDVFHSIGGDRLVGGAGDDVYNLWDANSTVLEKTGEGVDTINVRYWGGIVLPDHVENVFLMSGGASWATGNALNNIIAAGDVGARLNGGAGHDILVGGKGADIFEVNAGNGSDAIVGFQAGWDIVKLSGYGFTSFDQLKAKASQVGADVKVQLSSSETLVLRDVKLSALSAADFNLPMTAATYTSGQYQSAGQAWNAKGWIVNNNAWGAADLKAGQDYTMTSHFDTANMTKGTTFTWSFPVRTTLYAPILAYPEIAFGVHPGTTNPTETANVFPVKVGDLVGMTANFDVSFAGNTGGFDVAYDIWFTKTPNGGKADITSELMIWIHKGDLAPFGTAIGTYVKGDFSATIYDTGTYTAVVADKDVTAGSIDMVDLLAKLQSLGVIDKSEYMRSVEFGAEVVSGSGSLTINDMSMKVESRDSNGGTTVKTVTGTGTTVQSLPPKSPITTGLANLLDGFGRVAGTTVTTIGAAGDATTVKRDMLGNLTGTDIVSFDATGSYTKHFDVNGAFSGVDRIIKGADGSVSTQHFDASWALTGADKAITDASGAVTTLHFDATWKITGSEKAVVTGNATAIQRYDGTATFLGSDRVIANADGSTSVQHYDAKSKLVGADLIKSVGATTTTFHYNAAMTLLGQDQATLQANGTTKTVSLDAGFRTTLTSWTGTDKAETLSSTGGATDFHSGAGADTLVGGAGVDRFYFETSLARAGVDEIVNFTSGTDKLMLDDAVFTALKVGQLSASEFTMGTQATTAAQHLIYDKASGNLFYDADGNGAQAATLIAHLVPNTALSVGDFAVM